MLKQSTTAAQPNIGGALCESSVIPFLVPCHKVWLTAAAREPCSNAGNIGEHKNWMQSKLCSWQNSVKNVYIVYQPRRRPNIWQSFVDLRWATCSNEAKTWNRLKYAGVPQTHQLISVISGLKFSILRGHLEEILLLNKFFSDCRYMP